MTTQPVALLDAETRASLQANLDGAVTDRAFVGDWQEPWPSIRVEELGQYAKSFEVPGTKTTLRADLSYGVIRVESFNPYLGIDRFRLVSARSSGDPARIGCEC